MKKNPIDISNFVTEKFLNYIKTTYAIDDGDYQEELTEKLENMSLYKGPFLVTSLPFKRGNTIYSLIQQGIVTPRFQTVCWDLHRPLYLHQEKAFSLIHEGKNAVITTGTGSGKTESFLLPIINEILSVPQRGKGVKAIFLYPMNALVNDQMDRIRDLLRECPYITFGTYTGETEDKSLSSAKRRLKYPNSPDNELITREEMRKNPPDLLFTNFSMLEYLMIRPNDEKIIGTKALTNWKFMVLDESHTYRGTKGVEIAMLLRRLQGLAEREPQFILTSATLGTEDEAEHICKFGESLTGSTFHKDQIIFASREKLDIPLTETHGNGRMYMDLFAMREDPDAANVFYNSLYQDENVIKIYNYLQKTQDFNSVKTWAVEKLGLSEEELIVFLQLISLAESKEGKRFFDTRYHLFLKSPDKGFVTLGPKKQFYFNNRKTISGLKAFEAGICKNCNHLYIMGRITLSYVRDESKTSEDIDSLYYLDQATQVDVYDQYDYTMARNKEFFIIDDGLEEDFDDNDEHKFLVCAKCGAIKEVSDVNGSMCSCGDEYLVKLLKIENSNSEMRNNIHQCVVCGYQASKGIVRSFDMNKDEATAIIAENFMDAVDDKSTNDEPSNLDLFGEMDLFSSVETIQKNKKVHQLLAFSDSRQQAAYFAVTMQNDHEAYLRRHLLVNLLEGGKQFKLNQLRAQVNTENMSKDLFSAGLEKSDQESWITVLYDCLQAGTPRNGETLALYSYSLNHEEILPRLKKNEIAIQNRFGLTPDEFMVLIEVAVLFVRKKRAIDYTEAALSPAVRRDAFDYAAGNTYFIKNNVSQWDGQIDKNYLYSFLPATEGRENEILRYVKKICGCTREEAHQKLDLLFTLMINLKIFKDESSTSPSFYAIPEDRFVLTGYESCEWYQCDTCKKVTRWNVKNMCPSTNCDGHLHKCNPDEIFKNNYYRNMYRTKPLEKIIVKEHTAQLSPELGREYQDEFKNKKINVLSCSTTFEMGVDLGTLENVFLRNVPPTPANYVQRAGRAGRSRDASALVITYCGSKSHDFSYFMNPQEMYQGKVIPPAFTVKNRKLMLRHLTAAGIGSYFRYCAKNGQEKNYQNMTDFLNSGAEGFRKYLLSEPPVLKHQLVRGLLKEVQNEPEYNQWKLWTEEITGENSELMKFVQSQKTEIEDLKKCIQEYAGGKDIKICEYAIRQLASIQQGKVINELSADAVIPKYGFPVDVVELQIMGSVEKKDNNYRLQRDLMQAISEYVPGSDVIVDGKKYTSKYVNVPKNKMLPQKKFITCSHCNHTFIAEYYEKAPKSCPNCCSLDFGEEKRFIIPEKGFSTDRNSKKSAKTKPVRYPSGRFKYIGRVFSKGSQ